MGGLCIACVCMFTHRTVTYRTVIVSYISLYVFALLLATCFGYLLWPPSVCRMKPFSTLWTFVRLRIRMRILWNQARFILLSCLACSVKSCLALRMRCFTSALFPFPPIGKDKRRVPIGPSSTHAPGIHWLPLFFTFPRRGMRRCAKGLAARHEAVAPRRRSRVRIRSLRAGPLRVLYPLFPLYLCCSCYSDSAG